MMRSIKRSHTDSIYSITVTTCSSIANIEVMNISNSPESNKRSRKGSINCHPSNQPSMLITCTTNSLENIGELLMLYPRFQSSKKSRMEDFIHPLLHLIINPDYVNHLSIHFFSLLTMHDIANFDAAFTNHTTRTVWLTCPKQLYVDKTIKITNDDDINWCITRNIQLSSIKFIQKRGSEAKQITDEAIANLTTQCEYLNELTIEYNSREKCHITTTEFSHFISHCVLLERLTVYSFHAITDESLAAIGNHCHQLISISINNCDSNRTNDNMFTNIGIHNLFQGCLKLRLFDFTGCQSQDRYDFLSPLGTYCHSLEVLNICYTNLSIQNIQLFAKGCGSSLKTIHMDFVNEITDDMLIAVGNHCTSLQHLFIGHSLRELTEVTDEGISRIVRGCNHLKAFEIVAATMLITDHSFGLISRYCPLLEILSLRSNLITDITYTEVGKLKYIKEVSFGFNKNLTDVGLMNLVSGGTGSLAGSNLTAMNDIIQDVAIIIVDGDTNIASVIEKQNGGDGIIMVEEDDVESGDDMELIETDNNVVADVDTIDGASTATTYKDQSTLQKQSLPIYNISKIEKMSLIINGEFITNASLYTLAHYCPHLKSLTLYDRKGYVEAKALEYLVQSCTQLSAMPSVGGVMMSNEMKEILTKRKAFLK